MTRDSSHDNADENKGKYDTDEEITFDRLLKKSLRERDENGEKLDDLVNKNRGLTPPEREAKKANKQGRQDAKQQREEKASRKRKALADAIGEAHTSKPSLRIASGETNKIGLYTTYEFARTKINNRTCYYIVQITDRSYERHDAKLAVKDFGTDWAYSVPELDTDALQKRIAQKRKEDLRAGREPVAWLTESQYGAIEDWYQRQVESALLCLEDQPRNHDDTISLLDHYLVVEGSKSVSRLGRYAQELTNKQKEIISRSLLDLVLTNTDLSVELYNCIQETIDQPLLAHIEFKS